MTAPQTAVLGDPTGARVASVMVKYAAPNDVLDASVDTLFDVPRLPCNFADRRMEYPIHSKTAAWASAAGYLDSGESDGEIANRIREAWTYHRIPTSEWARLAKIAADSRQTTPAAVKYALADDRKYPVDTAEQIETAASYFHKYANQFDPETRKKYAHGLLSADTNGVLGLDTAARLEAEAGLAAPNLNWVEEFDKRAFMSPDPMLKDALTNVVTQIKAAGFDNGRFHAAGEIADLLRQVDRRMGWDFPDPLLGLTGETPSTARAKLAKAVDGATGDWYAVEDLDRLPDTDFSAIVGGTPIVSRTAKVAALRDPKLGPLVATALEDYGVRPISKARPKTAWAEVATR